MSREEEFAKLHEDALRELAPKLRPLLEEMYARFGPGQAFIQFITGLTSESKVVTLISYPEFWIPDKGLKVEVLRPDTFDSGPMGLTRWAATHNRTIIYPTDPESKLHYAEVDSRVQTEIVGPIHFRGRVTGVVLYDCIQPGRVYAEDERGEFDGFLLRIDEEIHKNIERLTAEPKVREQLTAIVYDCYKETLSARGYIAIKRWDGLLEYFKVGEGTDMFLELAPHEGLCGKVLRTGEMVNKKKLFSESHYIPSDTNIQSEIVCPIKFQYETIGVINLESYSPNAYDKKVEDFLKDKAELAAKSALFYRTPSDPDVGLAIADLCQTSLWIRPPESQSELENYIRETLGQWLMKLLKGKRYAFWLKENTPKPPFLQEVSWAEAVKGTSSSAGPRNTVFAPVLLQGEPLFVMALELEGKSKSQDQNTMKALCRVASEAWRRARYEYRMRRFIALTNLLISQSCNEVVINQAVREIPFILQSNHCTLFYLLQYNGRSLFVPGPSTAKQMYFKGQHPGYLPTLNDGLTGFVAERGKSLRIHDVRDTEELKEFDEQLVWKLRVSEEVEWDCRSYLACPVFDFLDHTRVVGVLRTHRDAKSHRSGFTDEDDGMFETIAHLLSKPLSVFLEKKSYPE